MTRWTLCGRSSANAKKIKENEKRQRNCPKIVVLERDFQMAMEAGRLEFADVGKKGGHRSHWRMKGQQSQGSERVNEEPKSHAYRNPRKGKMLWLPL
jgi:hypothetical protein